MKIGTKQFSSVNQRGKQLGDHAGMEKTVSGSYSNIETIPWGEEDVGMTEFSCEHASRQGLVVFASVVNISVCSVREERDRDMNKPEPQLFPH